MEQRKHIFYTKDKEEIYAIFIYFCVRMHLKKDEIVWMKDAIQGLYADIDAGIVNIEDKKEVIKALKEKLKVNKKMDRKMRKVVQIANDYSTQADIVDYAKYCEKNNLVF